MHRRTKTTRGEGPLGNVREARIAGASLSRRTDKAPGQPTADPNRRGAAEGAGSGRQGMGMAAAGTARMWLPSLGFACEPIAVGVILGS